MIEQTGLFGQDMVQFGVAEYLYLLAATGGEGAERAIAFSGLPQELRNDRVMLAGGSSLFARGWLEADEDGTLAPVREAAAISLAAGRAESRVRGALTRDEGESVGELQLTRALDLELLALSGPLGTWAVGAVDESVGGAGAIVEIFLGHLEEHPAGALFLEADRGREPAEVLYVRRSREDTARYDLARGRGTSQPPAPESEPVTGEQLEELLADLCGEVD